MSQDNHIDEGDIQATLTRWRTKARVEPVRTGKGSGREMDLDWPDELSRSASSSLADRGISLPWKFGDRLGEHDFRVIGLRLGGTSLVLIVESTVESRKKEYAAKTLDAFLEPDYLEMSPRVQEKISRAFLEETLPWLEMGQHPHIVSVHLLNTVVHPEFKRSIPFVYSEYMPGGNLRQYQRKKRNLKLSEVAALGIQLCDGLIHAASHGLESHEDLKPDNVMVYREGVFKITDFGVDVIGTPGYMAPEQAVALWKLRDVSLVSGSVPIDHRADQFAVGLILLEMILGRHPFPVCLDACNDRNAAERYVNEGIGEIREESLPGGLKRILGRALSPGPADRYGGMAALRASLLDFHEEAIGTYTAPEGNEDDSAEWWYNRGRSFHALRRLSREEGPFQEALKRYREMPGTELRQANCTEKLAIVYEMTDRFREADETYEEALSAYRRITGTELSQAKCLVNQGILLQRTGRSAESENAYARSLTIFRRTPGTERYQAACITNLANIFRETGRFEEAKRAFDESLTAYRRIPGTELEQARCIMNLAAVFADTGRYGDAVKSYEEAMKSYQRIPGTEFERAFCQNNLAQIYRDAGRFDEARDAFEEAMESFRKIPGTEFHQADCMSRLAGVFRHLGKTEKAFRYAANAMKLIEQFPPEATTGIRDECRRIIGEKDS